MMMNRHALGAAILAVTMVLNGAAPAKATPLPGSSPTLQYGGFEIAQNLWACSVIVNNALADAVLTIDETLSTEGPTEPQTLPVKVAGDRSVKVGVICLPSATNVSRVLVVAASTSSPTAEAYRNAIRADIAARAKGSAGQPFRGGGAGLAPSLVVAYQGSQGGGHKANIITPARAAIALQRTGLSVEPATPGGEVGGRNGSASVVVAGNVCPLQCSLPNGVFAVFSSSTDATTASAYRDAVQKAILAP